VKKLSNYVAKKKMIFEPLETGDSLFGMIALGAIIGLIVGIWAWKTKKQILMMLGFFGALILGGNAFFIYLSTPKAVELYDDRIVYTKGTEKTYSLKEVRSSKIESNLKVSNNSDESFERVLLIELTKKRTILLAESQYPIREIKAALDEKMAAFKK
jgi:hypothetical protein